MGHREIRQEQNNDTTLDQDFVAPAHYHMPFEVVSVKVSEHQHQERTPSGVVSWTIAQKETADIVRRSERMKKLPTKVAMKLWKIDRNAQMIRQNTENRSKC